MNASGTQWRDRHNQTWIEGAPSGELFNVRGDGSIDPGPWTRSEVERVYGPLAKSTARPPMPIEPPIGWSCDWGGCHQPADTWRYDNQQGNGWLPVCMKCSRTTWGTHHGDRSR